MAVEVARQNYPSFASSIEEKVKKLEPFFGPPLKQLSDGGNHNVATLPLHEYFSGSSLFLANTIAGLVLDREVQSWYTTVCLPWVYTEEMTVTLNEWIFNNVPVGRVPSEGVSRMITSSKRQFKTRIVRRGLGFMVEYDFYTTPGGKQQYNQSILTIAQSVQLTQNMDTIYALLECKTYRHYWDADNLDSSGHLSIDQILDSEIADYATLAYGDDRLQIIVAKAIKQIYRHGSAADMLVVPPMSLVFMKLAEDKSPPTYYVPSEKPGELTALQGPLSSGLIQGLRVYETQDFPDEQNTKHFEQPLTRTVRVGERYEMVFRRTDDIYDYQTNWRDIYIINTNTGKFEKIGFRQAFEHAKLFDRAGEWHKKLKSYLNKVNNSKSGSQVNDRDYNMKDVDDSDSDGDDDYRSNSTGSKVPRSPFFLFYENGHQTYDLIKYFGHMTLHSASHRDFIQTAQSIMSSLSSEWRINTDVISSLFTLITNWENEPYDREFFKELIKTNIANSINTDGQFIGHMTPPELTNNWQVSNLREWTPNSYGSLVLPRKTPGMKCNYPPGFCNWPGLLTVSKEALDSESGWQNLGKEVAPIVNFLRLFVDKLRRILPESEVLKENNRATHFHHPDPVTTFFSEVISISRDPLWLAFLPSNIVSSTLSTEVGDYDDVPNFSIPLFNIPNKEIKNAIDTIRDNGVVPNFSYSYTRDGEEVTMTTRMIPTEVKAFCYMGTNSFDLLSKMRDTADNDDEQNEQMKRLYRLILSYCSSNRKNIVNIRKVVTWIDEDFGRLSEIIGASDAPKSSKEQLAVIRKILRENSIENDTDLEWCKDPLLNPMGGGEVSKPDTDFQKAVDTLFNHAKNYLKSFDLDAIVKDENLLLRKITDDSKRGEVTRAVKVIKGNDIEALKSLSAVDMSRQAVLQSQYYRCPLTTSYELMRSISSEEAPLVRFSDSRTMNLVPYAENDRNVPHEIWSRPEYATISSIIDKAEKKLESSSTLRKHIKLHMDDENRSGKLFNKIGRHQRTVEDNFDVPSYDDEVMDLDVNDGKYTINQIKSMGNDKNMVKRRPFYAMKKTELFYSLYSDDFSIRFTEANKEPNPILRWILISFLMAPCDKKEHWLRLINQNVHVPINLMLWRLNIACEMGSFVVLKSGLATGANFFGHANFQLGNDATNKTFFGHFTFCSKASVHHPNNVVILENVKPIRYLGGSNTGFITRGEQLKKRSLNGASIVVTAMPIRETHFPRVMTITEKFPFSDAKIQLVDVSSYTGGIWLSTSGYYNHVYRFDEINGLSMDLSSSNFVDFNDKPNMVALQGLQINYNVKKGTHDMIVEGQGHRGTRGSLPGAEKVWNGLDLHFPTLDFVSMRLD